MTVLIFLPCCREPFWVNTEMLCCCHRPPKEGQALGGRYNAIEYKDRKRKFWKKRFDDQVIRDQRMFYTKLKYIHNNPVKAGLVTRPEEYRYSSARNYINGNHSIIWVNTGMLSVIIE